MTRPFTYGGNTPPALVTSVLERAGGARAQGDEWDLYWAGRISPDDAYRKLDGRRRVAGFKGLSFLCTKNGLARTLERARSLCARRVAHDLFDFAPRSFVFPAEFQEWRVRAHEEPETIWISKVGFSGRGEGVNLVTDLDAVQPIPDLVLQEYVAAPHLIDGHKYTLRVFVAITSLDPLRVSVFPDGLTKLTTRPFTLDRSRLGDRFVHLTNPSVLRADAGVDLASKRMTRARYRELLRGEGHDDAALFRAIDAIVAKTVLAAREPLLKVQADAGLPVDGAFTLVGLDVLVDREMRPWLLEVNWSPSLAVESDGESESARAEGELKTGVVAGLLALLGLGPDAPTRYEAVLPSPRMFEWLPAYEEIRASDLGAEPRVTVDPTVTIERDTPDALVLVHERHDHRIELNATGALTWRSLTRGESVAETIRAVAEQDGPACAADDVWEALATFAQIGAWTVKAWT